jgi:hypothetical protein
VQAGAQVAEAGPQDAAPARAVSRSPLLTVTLPVRGDLYDVITRVAAMPGVAAFAFMPLDGTLVEASDSYRVRGEKLRHWYTETVTDGPFKRNIRRNHLPADSLLVVEYRRRPTPGERSAFLGRHRLRPVDPETPDYGETPPELHGMVDFLRCGGKATATVAAISQDTGAAGFVHGAIEALEPPAFDLKIARYFRPRHLQIEFAAGTDPQQVSETLRTRDLRETLRTLGPDSGLAVQVELPRGRALFQSIREIRADRWVRNSGPLEVGSDNEVQLRAGHRFQRETPFRTYEDRNGDIVPLHAIDRLLVITHAAGTSRRDRDRVARELDLTYLPMMQNLGPLEPNLIYEVPAATTARDLAAMIRSREDLRQVVTGAAPGLFDSELMTPVYAPERWLRVAFEPKLPEGEIRALLARYQLVPAMDPDRPAAEDPSLHPGGAFWNYYVSRRIPLVVTAGDPLDVLTRIAREPGVLWAHPFALTPSLDRGSRIFLVATGEGWHQHPKLDPQLSVLVHLWRTTSPEVVRGYAERARIKLVDDRPQVLIQVGDPAPHVLRHLEDRGLAVIGREGDIVFGTADISRLFELADLPEVQSVRQRPPGAGRP